MTKHFTITKRARETGRDVTVVHGEDEGLDFEDDGPWYTICDDHGFLCAHRTLRLASSHASNPLGWCEDCMAEHNAKTQHVATSWTAGRPKVHGRSCSCGWTSSGMSAPRYAQDAFDFHVYMAADKESL